ncbi:MAG: alpha/beta fold hydrolase, partial [Anaerolineae bacterium]|nr:alpha/beta fold hydrolase [Anaerolineae bacterium]
WAAFTAQHRVIRYDARGFGRSSVPGGSYTPVEDQAALLDHLGVDRAHILGLSRGGGIAIDFALAYPERSLSLIAVDAILHGHAWHTFGQDLSRVWALGKEAPLDVVKETWLSLPLLAPAMERPDLAVRLRVMVADYSGWHWLNRDQGRAVRPHAAERLAEIHAPTLILNGERDLPDFHAVADRLAQGIPGAQRVILPGVGHMSNMEDPAGFNRVVLDFLATCPPPNI